MVDTVERLTADEIESRYPSHWLLLSDCEYDSQQTLMSGVVVSAHATRAEVLKALREQSVGRFAMISTIKRDPKRMWLLCANQKAG